MKIGAVYCVYDDDEFLEVSLEPVKNNLDKVLFLISDVPWFGKVTDNSSTISKIKNLCLLNSNFELVQDHWVNEADQRNFGLTYFYSQNIDYCFIIDTDEIYQEEQFKNIIQYISTHHEIVAFHIYWNTYWTKQYYVITPREEFTPLIAVKTDNFIFTSMRQGITGIQRTKDFVFTSKQKERYNGVIINKFCFHLSYARTNEKIKRKIETFSHANQINKTWYEEVWKKWRPTSKNLHPIEPSQYNKAEKENFLIFPDALKLFIKNERLSNLCCSIIIINWNSFELLTRCIELISINTKIFYEIIIVDNGSKEIPSNFSFFASQHNIKKIIFNKINLGFPAAVNQAIDIAEKNTDICLINVDAEPQKNWLENLYYTLNKNPIAGIVGPLGNEIESGYQKEKMVTKDTKVFNVHFYCVLIFRELIERIGKLDTRFELGSYEDNDFCIRSKLAGYECWISSNSLVKHKAHQVFEINNIDNKQLEKQNKVVLQNKLIEMLYHYGSFIDFISISSDIAKKCGLIIKD